MSAEADLEAVFGNEPCPGISDDGKLEVVVERGGGQFLPVAGDVLVILPVATQCGDEAAAGRFRNVDENEALLVADQGEGGVDGWMGGAPMLGLAAVGWRTMKGIL